jgi:hypothetical protein
MSCRHKPRLAKRARDTDVISLGFLARCDGSFRLLLEAKGFTRTKATQRQTSINGGHTETHLDLYAQGRTPKDIQRQTSSFTNDSALNCLF